MPNNTLTPPEGFKRYTGSSTELNILDAFGCPNQISNLSLRRIFLLLLRNFFSNPNNFNVSYPIDWVKNYKEYTYSDPIVDPESLHEDTIDIVLSHQYADNIGKMEYLKEGQKPQIIVNIGDFDYQEYNALNDTTTLLDNGYIHGENAVCNITISSYGRNYEDASVLSQLVASFLIGMRPFFYKRLNLKAYKPIKLSAPVCLNSDKATKTFKSDFILQLIFESNFISKQECLLIKTVNLNMLTEI